MPSKIQVDQIAGATGNTVTLPSGQTLDLSSGTVTLPSSALSALNATNLTSGTVPSARLSLVEADIPNLSTSKLTSGTLGVARGGTGLTTLGTASQVLRVNSGATALEFATAPSGKLLQAVTATDQNSRTTTSTSFTTASNTLSVSITPASASNKIFIIVSGDLYQSSASVYAIATIFRNAVDLGATGSNGLTQMYTPNGSDAKSSMCMTFLDSPSTTSAITYQVYIRSSGGSITINQNGSKGTITAFEIGA